MTSICKKLVLSCLLVAGWMIAQAQTAGSSPSQRLKLNLVDNTSTFTIDNEKNHYVNTLSLSQPDGPFQLTASMLNEGDNIITIKRQDDRGNVIERARINLKAVFNGTSAIITPGVSYYSDNSWSAEEPIGNAITCPLDEAIDLSSIELEDEFIESTADNLHPSRYEYSASMDANIQLPDPNIPVILTPDNDIDMGAETSVEVLVSGYYLTEEATLTTTGPFTVYPSTLTADQVNNGSMVTFTFTGSTHSGSGTLTVTSGIATLTVNISHRSAAPVIIANPTTVDISSTAMNGTFSVYGTDLAGPITVTGDANFTVNPTTISMADAMAGEVTVTITPKSGIYTQTNGTITLTSADAEPVTVQVIYNPPFYASIDFNKCTSTDNPKSGEIIGYDGWTLTNLTIYNPTAGQYAGYLQRNNSFTYTMPTTFTGNSVYVTVYCDGTGSNSAGDLSVNNSNHTFASGSSYTWAVNISAGGTITFAAPTNTWSCDIAKIIISAVNPGAMSKAKVVNHMHGSPERNNDTHELTIKQERRR